MRKTIYTRPRAVTIGMAKERLMADSDGGKYDVDVDGVTVIQKPAIEGNPTDIDAKDNDGSLWEW